MKKENKTKNGTISIWKFIFSIVIMCYHSKWLYPNQEIPVFHLGYIGVEFFFIVTGYYFTKSVLSIRNNNKELGKETFDYVLGKIKKFFPYIFVAFIIALPINAYYRNWDVNTIVNSFFNLTLFRGVGLGWVGIITQLWYISAMIVIMAIMYPILRKYKENYIYIFSPIFIVIGLVYMYRTGTLDLAYHYFNSVLNIGLIRAFVEINIGSLMFLLVQRIKNLNFTCFFKILLTIVSHFLLIMVLIVISIIDKAKNYEYIMLFMIMIALFIIFTEKTYGKRLFNNKFIYYLESLSMLIFINHSTFIGLVQYSDLFIKYTPDIKLLFIVLITIVFSVLEDLIKKIIIKFNLWNKTKKIFIK